MMNIKCLPISNTLLSNCKLLNDRLDIIKFIPENLCVAEIGVNDGNFSNYLLSKASKLYLLDKYMGNDFLESKYDKNTHFEYIKNKFKNNNNVEFLRGYIIDILSVFCQNTFDLIYIDGGYEPSYFIIKKILFMAYNKLKLGGLLWINDYTNYDPISNITYGVQSAVNELINVYNMDVMYFSLNGSNFHDICIRKTHDINSHPSDIFQNQLKLYKVLDGEIYSFKNQIKIIPSSLDIYLQKYITCNLHMDDIILDIGAGVGTHLLYCHNKVKTIYSFEYQHHINLIQQKNIISNKMKNVFPINCMIGHLNNVQLSLSNSLLDKDTSSMENKKNILMKTIDSFNYENRIKYIKIKTGSCLPLILYGAQYTIRKDKPVIIYNNNGNSSLLNEIKKSYEISIDVEKFTYRDICGGYSPPFEIGDGYFILIPN